MNNKKNSDISFEDLVGETLLLSDSSAIESSINLELNYIESIKAYRLTTEGFELDFPRSSTLIKKIISESYLELNYYDKELNDLLMSVLKQDENIIFYYMDDGLFIETVNFKEIKKAA